MAFEIDEIEYINHTENYDGICLNCGAWSCGGVEPDAEEYSCEECGEDEVTGAENALLIGELIIQDESEDEIFEGDGEEDFAF